jgi:hypothetical protein
MLNLARVLLGISILAIVISFGSCVACISVSDKPSHSYQLPDGRFVPKGLNEGERFYSGYTIGSFGVSLITLLLGGIAYGRYQAKERDEQKRGG